MSAIPEDAVVWTEIPTTDLKAAQAFYAAVIGHAPEERTDMGPAPVAVFAYTNPGTAGHIYQGKPAASGTGPTVHLAVEGTAEDAAARCTEAGGKVVSPVIEIPKGRFVYAEDPEGNSIGLFQGT